MEPCSATNCMPLATAVCTYEFIKLMVCDMHSLYNRLLLCIVFAYTDIISTLSDMHILTDPSFGHYSSLIIMGMSNDFVILMLSVNNNVSHIVQHYGQIYPTVVTLYISG